VRLYDCEAQKRPLFEVDWLDARITAVAPQPDGLGVWVANAKGFIQARVLPCCATGGVWGAWG